MIGSASMYSTRLLLRTQRASLSPLRPCPRSRWGILPGQDALVMDIGTLEVPEEDFSRLRQMQMSTMEWDEAGEAALRKGFRKGKRTKFMGERGGGGGAARRTQAF